MKISEVCEKTGLTKRTIRFYIEKGLINPKVYNKNGKDFVEYVDEDVKQLCAISNLRKLDISIESIGEMIENPNTVSSYINKIKTESRKNLLQKEDIYNTIYEIDKNKCKDIFTFSRQIEKSQNAKKILSRDLMPVCSVLDEMTNDEKRNAFEKFQNKMIGKNYMASKIKKMLKRLAIICISIFAVFLIAVGISWIPESVDIQKSGYCYDENSVFLYEDKIKISGKIYTPLFFADFFCGKITFENTPQNNFTAEKIVDFDSTDKVFPRNDYKNVAYIYKENSQILHFDLCYSNDLNASAYIFIQGSNNVNYGYYNVQDERTFRFNMEKPS